MMCRILKSQYLFVLVLSMIFFEVFSQVTQENQISTSFDVEKIPKSPGVSNLGKFTFDGMNAYNGTANISVPIFSIPFAGKSIPISLNYNTGGVLVNQDAGWVGLNWNLLENYSITREINGYDDLRNFLQQTPEGDSPAIGWIYSKIYLKFQGAPSYKIDISDADLLELNNSNISQNSIDTQPDLFTVNIPGKTIKFYLPKNIDNVNKLEADIVDNLSVKVYYYITENKFEFVDVDGSVYVFDIKEYSTGFSNWEYPNAVNDQDALEGIPTWSSNQSRMLNLAWKVSKITTVSNDILEFEYQDGMFFSYPSFSASRAVNPNYYGGGDSYEINLNTQSETSVSITAFHKKYLKKISGRFGKVDFVLGTREDLFSKESLSSITGNIWNPAIEPNVNNEYKLDNIIISNSENEVIKTFSFQYGYFNEHLNPTLKSKYYRLRLDEISVDDQIYRFDYVKDSNGNYSLPAKDSKSVDFWGFYNGKNNIVRIPSSNRFVYSSSLQREMFIKLNGANRYPDGDFGKLGNLREIIYPSKGATQFIYEPHTVSLNPVYYNPNMQNNMVKYSGLGSSEAYNFRYQYLKLAKENTYSLYDNVGCNINSSNLVNNSIFEIENSGLCNGQNYNITINANLSCNTGCGQGIEPSGRAVWLKNLDTQEEIEVFRYDNQFDSGNYNVSLSKNLNLSPGNYQLKSIAWSTNSPFLVVASTSVSGSFFAEAETNVADEEFEVGGVRIARIVHRGAENEIIKEQRYNYSNPANNLSSGKLMDDLIFHSKGVGYFEYTPEEYGTNPSIILFTSNNNLKTLNSAGGSHIGYTNVSVEDVDSQGQNIGRLESVFYNQENEYHKRYIGEVENFPVSGGPSVTYPVYGDVYFLPGSPVSHKSNGYLKNSSALSDENVLLKYTNNIYPSSDGNITSFSQYPVVFFAGDNISSVFPYHAVLNDFVDNYQISRLESRENIEYFNNDSIYTKEDYEYALDFVKKYSFVNSTNKSMSIEKKYSFDYSGGIYDDLEDNNQIVLVNETSFINSTKDKTRLYEYSTSNTIGEPLLSQEEVIFKNETEGKNILYTHYDVYGNPVELQQVNGTPVVYLWSYNGQYPVAKIENAELSQVASALGVTQNYLLNYPSSAVATLQGTAFRNSLSGALITTFTYDPLIGMTSMTDPGGRKTTYEYDAFGRLESTRDADNYLLEEYKYHYRNQ